MGWKVGVKEVGKIGNGGKGDGGWGWSLREVEVRDRDMGGKGGHEAGKVGDKK